LRIALILALAGPIASAASRDGGEREQMIFSFDNPQDAEPWGAVDDNVMGGVSDGRVRMTARGPWSSSARFRWRTTAVSPLFVPAVRTSPCRTSTVCLSAYAVMENVTTST